MTIKTKFLHILGYREIDPTNFGYAPAGTFFIFNDSKNKRLKKRSDTGVESSLDGVVDEVTLATFKGLTNLAIGDKFYITDAGPDIYEVRTVNGVGSALTVYVYSSLILDLYP